MERVYRVLGARGLGDAAGETHRGTVWERVTEETKGDYKFSRLRLRCRRASVAARVNVVLPPWSRGCSYGIIRNYFS